MEIIKILLLFIITIEIALILTKPDEKEEEEHKSRRDVYGIYKNPLGDTYRKNTKNQYVPIKPNSKMIDGDDEDEV